MTEQDDTVGTSEGVPGLKRPDQNKDSMEFAKAIAAQIPGILVGVGQMISGVNETLRILRESERRDQGQTREEPKAPAVTKKPKKSKTSASKEAKEVNDEDLPPAETSTEDQDNPPNEASKEEPKEEPKEAPKEEPKEAPKEEGKKLTKKDMAALKEDVRKALIDIRQVFDMPTAIGVLKEFDIEGGSRPCEKIGELPERHYQEALDRCNALLKPEETDPGRSFD
jgi:hypothetical protein